MLYSILRICIVAIACIFTFSCSYLLPQPEPLDSSIDLWLKDNQFDKIDQKLSHIDPKDIKYKHILKRKPSIEKKKNAYIDKTIRTATKLQKDNRWQDALNTYNEALENIEEQPKLIKARNKLVKERDQRVTELRKELLRKQANALISYKKIYQQLHQLIPEDYSAKFDISRYEKYKNELAEHLDKCGEQARKEKNTSVARDCYSLSNQLVPSKQKQAYVNQIDAQQKNKANQQRYAELLSAYDTAYKNNELNKARMHLKTLLAINPGHKKALSYLDSTQKQIDKIISEKLSLGKDFYSKKKIKEALTIWKEALYLDPEHEELNQLISRAEKVSKKIESLESTQ